MRAHVPDFRDSPPDARPSCAILALRSMLQIGIFVSFGRFAGAKPPKPSAPAAASRGGLE
jgi:hypothetical protein